MPNRCILLNAVPEGMPRESDFRLEEIATPECPEDGLLVRTVWVSVDPYLRGRISGVKSYIGPILVGSPMEGAAVGQVVESRAEGFSEGDIVAGMWAWQDLAAVSTRGVRKLNPAEAPISTAIGILGMPGMTAYFGLTKLCVPKGGETVVVSGAAGAVGSYVGQIAKILGCHVVGSAGSAEKLEYLRGLGFDGVLNYRTDKPYGEVLQRLCPNGIDCYFDNVGGEFTDAVIPLMNLRGRVAVCGQISQYNNRTTDVGPRPFWHMIGKQLKVEGFLVARWADRFGEGRTQMAAWLREGRLRYEETIYEGLESAPRAFIGLFEGANTGKALVRVSQV